MWKHLGTGKEAYEIGIDLEVKVAQCNDNNSNNNGLFIGAPFRKNPIINGFWLQLRLSKAFRCGTEHRLH